MIYQFKSIIVAAQFFFRNVPPIDLCINKKFYYIKVKLIKIE